MEAALGLLARAAKEPAAQHAIVLEHYRAMLSHYGREGGSRIARKHLGWYSKGMPQSAEFRAAVMREPEPDKVEAMLASFYGASMERLAA